MWAFCRPVVGSTGEGEGFGIELSPGGAIVETGESGGTGEGMLLDLLPHAARRSAARVRTIVRFIMSSMTVTRR
jgi:hypothetical protein